MKEYSVATGTVTNALKAKELLKTKGITVSIERMKHGAEKYGCGYAVLVKTKNISFLEKFLIENGVKVLKINQVN